MKTTGAQSAPLVLSFWLLINFCTSALLENKKYRKHYLSVQAAFLLRQNFSKPAWRWLGNEQDQNTLDRKKVCY